MDQTLIRRILCYGNSNTWGFNTDDGSRFPAGVRWPSVLQKLLGNKFHVIEEGYNGRTILDVYPASIHLFDELVNGTFYLPVCISRHNPLNLVIIYLGINDLFLSPEIAVPQIATGLGRIINITKSNSSSRNGTPSGVLVIAPPPVNPDAQYPGLFAGTGEKSRQLSSVFKKEAISRGCFFLAGGEIIEAVSTDGVHLDEENHIKLGTHVAAFVKAYIFHED
jgi:lysophospholipase L1-like esterase